MNKFLATVASVSIMAGVLAGCAGTGKQSPPDSTPKDAQVKLEFWTISLKPTFETYVNGVIKDYEAKHQNVKVVWTDLPYDGLQDKLLSAIAADEAPDVVNLNTELAVLIAAKGGLVNMDEVLKPEQKALYFDKLYQSAQYQGKTYALPWYAAGEVMFVNTDIMKKAGLDPAKPPQTWDELSAAAKVIKEKTKLDAFIPQGDLNRLFQDGVQILSPDKKKAAFNTPEAVAAVKWYADLFQQNVVSKDLVTKTYAEAVNQYMGGQMAFALTGPQFLKRVKEQSADIYKVTAVAPHPTGKVRVDQVPLMDVVVPAKSKHKTEAVDFSLFVTNDENQLAFAKVVPILPSTKKAAADDFFKAGGDTPEAKANALAIKQLETGYDLALGIGGKQAEVTTAITKAFQAAATGAKSPADALKEAEDKVNSILAQP